MDNVENYVIIIYSLSICCVIFLTALFHCRSWIAKLWGALRLPILKHLVFPAVSDTWHPLVEWSRADALALSAYIALNIFCLWFQAESLSSAGQRAAKLLMVTSICQYAALHLDSITNTLGLGWRTVRRLHGSMGIMAFSLLVFHVVVVVRTSSEPFLLDKPGNKWAVLAASAIGTLLLLSIPIFKNRFYEVFLRLHQALAVFSIYGVWVHLASRPFLSRLYLYSLIGVSGFTTLLLGSLTMYRNGLFGHGFPRATIINSDDVILLSVKLPRPLPIQAGQFVSLWVFTASARLKSLLQAHPFVVASWSDAPLTALDFLIEPRSGLTRQLLRHSRVQRGSCIALFSGPHGTSVPTNEYDVVLMFASGFGIAAQLPYLKKLMYGYNSRKARTRRVHLVWKLKTLGKRQISKTFAQLTGQELAAAVKDLLNDALVDDTLDDGYILKISIYVEQIPMGDDISPRATVIKGLPDFDTITREEVEGKHIRRVQEEAKSREDMLILVSASAEVRHVLRKIVQGYLDDRVDMVELDYQPDE